MYIIQIHKFITVAIGDNSIIRKIKINIFEKNQIIFIRFNTSYLAPTKLLLHFYASSCHICTDEFIKLYYNQYLPRGDLISPYFFL